MIDPELQYYIGKILCTADPQDPSKFLKYDFHHIFLVFGFTGSGKDTVINEFLKENQGHSFIKFIRTLSRKKRPSELEMFDGFFVKKELFDWLKDHGRFFYSYERYGYLDFGYDTLHLLFELSHGHVIMVGGSEANYEGLTEGIQALFHQIPITTIFINRPKEVILAHIRKRGGDTEEMQARLDFIEKEWYEKPQKPMDHFIWNEDLRESIQEFKRIVEATLKAHEPSGALHADGPLALIGNAAKGQEEKP